MLLVLAAPGFADQVDDYIREEMKKQHIPGLSFAVVNDGKLVKSGGYGVANVELNAPAKPETVYQLQSITKSFTATGIMLLVEEDKVGVDDKICKYLDALPDIWKEITVRHLLTHTSGIKDFINEPTVDLRKDITPQDVIKSLADKPLNFQPGEKYTYSNTGYHLFGMIIHQVTGKLWGDFLRERIFEPLGMTDTRVISLSEIITNRAAGYGWVNDKLENGRFIAPTILAYAGGGLRSTVLDLAKWDAALYTEKLLKRSSLEQMWTAATLNDGSKTAYGFGWGLGSFQGHKYVEHSGANITGFKTTFMRFVDEKLTIIVLTNQRTANPGNIAVGVAKLYLLPAVEKTSNSAKSH
ncbi:MAG: serine hydrolase [Verrucomicrobia bacterium]|nr:MAG: serine hydrolase [Verrucomicrobiota bacterium]